MSSSSQGLPHVFRDRRARRAEVEQLVATRRKATVHEARHLMEPAPEHRAHALAGQPDVRGVPDGDAVEPGRRHPVGVLAGAGVAVRHVAGRQQERHLRTDGVRATTVRGVQQSRQVGVHRRRLERQCCALGGLIAAGGEDRAEVRGGSRGQPDRALAQFPEQLVHLERRLRRLDGHPDADGRGGQAEERLELRHEVVPPARLFVMTQSRDVDVEAAPAATSSTAQRSA